MDPSLHHIVGVREIWASPQRNTLAWLMRRGVLLLLAVILVFFFLNSLRFPGNDFWVYYRAGTCFRAGADLYVVHNAFSPLQRFRYQPGTAALFAPLSLLTYPVAKAVWAALTVLMSVGVAAWLHRRFSARRWFAAPLAWLCFFHPLAQELQLGQVHMLVLVALVASFALEDRGCDYSAGALIALATAFKITPVLLLGDALLRRRWRAVAGFFLGLVALVATSALRYGAVGAVAQHAHWLQSQGPFTVALVDSEMNQSVFAIMRGWGMGSVGGLAVALALTFMTLSVRHLELRRALCLAALALVTPNGWVQGFIFAVPLTALLLAGTATVAWLGFALAVGTGLLGYDVVGPAGEAWTMQYHLLGVDMLALLLLGRFAATTRRIECHPRRPAVPLGSPT